MSIDTLAMIVCVCVCVQWKEAKSSELMDSKLKCVFEVSADGAKVRVYWPR